MWNRESGFCTRPALSSLRSEHSTQKTDQMYEMCFLGVPFNSAGTLPEKEHRPQSPRTAGLLGRQI